MKDYYTEAKRLIEFRDTLLKERKESTERINQINEEVRELKKEYRQSFNKDDRELMQKQIDDLIQEKEHHTEILSKDIPFLLIQEYDENKLNDLKDKAKSEYVKQLSDKRKEFNKAKELYQSTRSELRNLTDHNAYKRANTYLYNFKRTLERLT